MSVTRVDTYIKNLPRYLQQASSLGAEKTYQYGLNHYAKDTYRGFYDERRGHPVAVSLDGRPCAWRHIDFDPRDAWLGRLIKPLLELQVEPWGYNGHNWNGHYEEDDNI